MEEIKRTKFNISILGEARVGKTSICSVFLGKGFNNLTLQTVGLENTLVPVKFEGKKYKFKIFDTAGQERYRAIAKSTITLADGFLLVYAVDDKKTFQPLEEWIKSIKENCDINRKVLFLVGNKIDKENRIITNEEALSFANAHNIQYFETSAKDGTGIKEIFNLIFEEIYKKFKQIENPDEAENGQNNSKENTSPTIILGEEEINKKNKKDKGKKEGCC